MMMFPPFAFYAPHFNGPIALGHVEYGFVFDAPTGGDSDYISRVEFGRLFVQVLAAPVAGAALIYWRADG